MKKILLFVFLVAFVCGCSNKSIDYSFFENNGELIYMMEKTAEAEAEFKEKNEKALALNPGEAYEKDLYELLSPRLYLYTADRKSCFEYGCLYDVIEETYEISKEDNRITVSITRNANKANFVFEIIDQETLRFIQKDSSPIDEFIEDGRISIPDGAIFKLVTEE